MPPRTGLVAGAALAAALLLWLAFFHIERYPRLLFDEGSYLQIAENTAFHGHYAERSSEGYRLYGGTVGVGPTVLLPMALAMRLFGPTIAVGRGVVALSLLAAVACFFLAARQVGGTKVALLATALAVSAPALSLLTLGRQAMGEVPALLFLSAGLWLWFRRWQDPSTASLATVGLLFGLAAISKQHVFVSILAGLGLAAAANALWYRLRPHRQFLLPLAVCAAANASWSAVLLYGIASGEQRAEILEAGAAVGGASTFLLQPSIGVRRSLAELLRPGAYFGLLFPSLAFALWRAREQTAAEQRWSVVAAFAVGNLLWYALLTVGWIRYAFVGLGMAALLVARMLAEWPARGPWAWLRAPLLALALAGVTLSLGRLAVAIAGAPPSEALAMAEYLRQRVPTDAIVETWEPEAAFVSDHRFHYPPARLIGAAITHVEFGAPPVWHAYDALAAEPAPPYVLLGEFSVYVHAYRLDLLRTRYRRLAEIGAYQIYERIAPP